MEDCRYWKIHTAPEQYESLLEAQQKIERRYQATARETFAGERLDMSLMARVLHEIKSNDIILGADFAGLSQDDSARWLVHRDVFLAILMTGVKVVGLSMTLASCAGLKDLLAVYEDDLLEIATGLSEFNFTSSAMMVGADGYARDDKREEAVGSLALATKIVGQATELLILEISLDGVDEGEHATKIATSLLLPNSVSSLIDLRIESADIVLDDLLKVLARCEKSLTHLTLGAMAVVGRTTGWVEIFHLLSTMQTLHSLDLSYLGLRTTAGDYMHAYLSGGAAAPCSELYEVINDREALELGLQHFLHGGVKLVLEEY